ncbi:GILT-like protein 1 [Periplaneta americana]|uniref:GILT-like protein 1 n=1 Tax=Periplaneta americana TaxID=6978 RepID=UPI0037E8E764
MKFILVAVLVIFSGAHFHVDARSVKLSVYYECLCPDSVNFIKFQMYPTWLLLGKDILNLDFIPYGKATQTRTNSTWTFDCQHGQSECQGNKEQACALDYLRENATAQVQYVTCVMSARYPPWAGPQCAYVIGINYNPIEYCADGERGNELLAAMGNRTHRFRPEITFVPTIVLNDVYTQANQDAAMTNLLHMICQHMHDPKPAACDG